VHHYRFRLYARSKTLVLAPTTPAGQATQTIAGAALATRLAFSAAESATRAGSYRSRLLTPLAVQRLSFNPQWAFALLAIKTRAPSATAEDHTG